MGPILTVMTRTFLIALLPSFAISLISYGFLFRPMFSKFYGNWRNSKRVARMPDLYLISRPHELRQLAIGESGIVSKSAVSVDKKGRIWLREDERLSASDELTVHSAWHAVQVERTGKNSWRLTLPITPDGDLPKFERSKTFWTVDKYLPVTEVREMQIKSNVEKWSG